MKIRSYHVYFFVDKVLIKDSGSDFPKFNLYPGALAFREMFTEDTEEPTRAALKPVPGKPLIPAKNARVVTREQLRIKASLTPQETEAWCAGWEKAAIFPAPYNVVLDATEATGGASVAAVAESTRQLLVFLANKYAGYFREKDIRDIVSAVKDMDRIKTEGLNR